MYKLCKSIVHLGAYSLIRNFLLLFISKPIKNIQYQWICKYVAFVAMKSMKIPIVTFILSLWIMHLYTLSLIQYDDSLMYIKSK